MRTNSSKKNNTSSRRVYYPYCKISYYRFIESNVLSLIVLHILIRIYFLSQKLDPLSLQLMLFVCSLLQNEKYKFWFMLKKIVKNKNCTGNSLKCSKNLKILGSGFPQNYLEHTEYITTIR